MKLNREFFCLQPSLARLYSAAASPSERLCSDGSLAISSIRTYKGFILERSLAGFLQCGKKINMPHKIYVAASNGMQKKADD